MKTIDTLPPAIASQLPALRMAPGAVDQKRSIVRGVALLQRGDLNEGDSRPWFIDDETMSQALSLAMTHTKGLKARWTHPNMSNDGLGQFLGRWRKPRLSEDGGTLLADLHLARVAFRGGDQSRGQWVLDMAADDPDAFGVSLAPIPDTAAMEALEDADGRSPMRFSKLIAGDVVDEPAATRGGLYGGGLSIATAPAAATGFLDTMFADADAEVIRGRAEAFLSTYLSNRFGETNENPEADMADDKKIGADSEAVAKLTGTVSDLSTKLDSLADTVGKIAKPKEAPTEPVDQKALLSAERTRTTELIALAKNSGLSDADNLSNGWIEKGLSVVEAKAALGDLAIAQNKLTSDSGEPSDDADAALKAEYKSQLSVYQASGTSEADFIASRKLDAEQSEF